MIRVVGNLLVLLSAIEASGFVVVYWATAPWWRSPMGRNVMSLMFVIALVLDLSVVRIFVPGAVDLLWFNILRLVVFALVPVVLGMRLWLLVKVQVMDRRQERDGG